MSSAETRSHRALVRLRSTAPIYLSNAQVSSLCNALKEQLVHLLLVATPESLRLSSTAKEKDTLRMVIDCGGWKVRLEMKMDFVMGLRFGSVEEGPKVLIRRPKEMVNEEVASEPKILQEEDEDDMIRIPDEGEKVPIQTDQKKILKYSYKSMRVMGKDVRIEVLKVPKI